MDFLYIFERLAELFIIMFIGYGIVAGKLIPQIAMKYFSNFIFYVTLPAMIIYSLSGGTNVPAEEVFEILIISTLIHGFLIIVSLTVPKLIRVPKDRIGLYSFMLLFGNVAFLGFPVVKAVIGEEALFHTALFNLPFNLLVFTIGVYYITKDTKMKGAMNLKKFINPGIVATL
ncbi:MAG: AEC family transporter, partial [Vallitaleaceae bacterium]|nr:AEC family transporter [Vallitaleaceae bacterium]